MTISITKARAVHNGSGSTGPFAIADGADGIYFAASSELLVTKTVDGTETVLALGSDYTVTGAGSASGTLTLAVALAVGETLTIERRTALTQTVNLSSSGAFDPTAVMGALDKLTRQTQDHRSRIDRSLEFYKDDVEGSGSFNARDNAIAKTKYLELKEIATPSDPGAGYHRLYFKDDGDLYMVDSDGTELNISVQVTSADEAAASAATATAAAATAVAALEQFEDLYLGAKASDPSVDNDGDALVDGMLYYNTSNDELKVYTGSAWSVASPYPVTSVDNAIGAVVVNAAKPFATRTALKAADTTKITSAVLTEGRRGGVFAWTTGDYSALVAIDPEEGIYIEADAVAATSGAWVRVGYGIPMATWWGATGDGVTDDRAACQAAVDFISDNDGGDLGFPDGDYLLTGVASSDSLDNGIVIPWDSQFTVDKQIRLIAMGRASLIANSNDMIVVRASRPGTEVIGLDIDGGKGGGLTGTWGIGAVAEDRTQTANIVSQSFLKVERCHVHDCTEGLVLEPGPSTDIGGPSYAGSGAYYPVINNNHFNLNLRSMCFMEATNDPLNRCTRGNIAFNRIERGNTGIELIYATEFTLIGNNFQYFRTANGGTSPHADCAAIRVTDGSTGLSPENNQLISGESEGCDYDIYNAATLPHAIVPRDFPLSGVLSGMNFSPRLGYHALQLTRRSASYEQLHITAHHSGFARIYFDHDLAGATSAGRDFNIETNGVRRYSCDNNGLHTFRGTTSNVLVTAAGTGIQCDRTGAFAISATGAGSSISMTVASGASALTLSSTALFPGTDNALNLGGSASFRWKEIFCANGTINTSDARQKKWRGGLSDAELRVAARVAKLTGVYQMLASVEEKGDAARLHVGIRVQDVIACFEAEGLDAFDYAMICYDKWDDITEPVMTTVNWPIFDAVTGERMIDPDTNAPHYEEREVETGETRVVKPAGDLYGIRDGQLRAFVQAAQEQRLDAMEARLAALERPHKGR